MFLLSLKVGVGQRRTKHSSVGLLRVADEAKAQDPLHVLNTLTRHIRLGIH